MTGVTTVTEYFGTINGHGLTNIFSITSTNYSKGLHAATVWPLLLHKRQKNYHTFSRYDFQRLYNQFYKQ
jgi:3-methyladenine DNA glycosylase Tag